MNGAPAQRLQRVQRVQRVQRGRPAGPGHGALGGDMWGNGDGAWPAAEDRPGRPGPWEQQAAKAFPTSFLVNQLHPNVLQPREEPKLRPSLLTSTPFWAEHPGRAPGVALGAGAKWTSQVRNLAISPEPGQLEPGSPDSVRSVSRLIAPARPATHSPSSSKKPGSRVIPILAAVSLLEGALIIVLVVFTYFYSRAGQREAGEAGLCQSPECVRSAASLLRAMDTSVSPCEDFYRYTCGRWSEDHPPPAAAFSHDWFYERKEHVLLDVRDFLGRNTTEEDPWAVNQARILFEACMDYDARESLGLEPMLSVLEAAGLPRRPPLTATPGWSWVRSAALARRHINKDLLINLAVYPDTRNRSVNRIHVNKYRSGSPLPGYHAHRLEERRRRILARAALDSEDGDDQGSGDSEDGVTGVGRDPERDEERHIAAYLSYMTTTITILMRANETRPHSSSAGGDVTTNSRRATPIPPACTTSTFAIPPDVEKSARKVLLFNKALYKLAYDENKTRENDYDSEEMGVKELQNLTRINDTDKGAAPPMNWTEYLEIMFEGIPNVTLDLVYQDKILVEDETYLRSLAELLANTPIDILELSLWWELVDLLAPFTTSEMRQLRRRYQEIASGTSAARPREAFCTESVNGLMGMAVSVYMLQPHYRNTTGAKVLEMLTDVQNAFESLVGELDWMDPFTKNATLEKVRAMKSYIGFPDWLSNATELNYYYEGLNMTKDAYLEDLLSFQRLVVLSALSSLREKNDEGVWATDPTDVNAFHTFQANSVTIPAGILQFPFYDLGLEALNYGAIGSILGHELTHGFDNNGRLFDKDGNMQPWWSNRTVEEYENRTSCFIEQYSEYVLSEVEMNVDGELTLGENIADNGGLHESVRAYRRYLGRHRIQEPLLPGMANYTHEQLLFLSYVHVWCESWTKESLRWALEDEHAPNRVRAWGVLSNSEDFAAAWGCPKGSPMNPHRRRCRLW